MTITIPIWLLWAIGGAAIVLPLLYYAVIGIALACSLKDYPWTMRR